MRALLRTGEDRRVGIDILKAVEAANERQKRVVFDKLSRHFDGKLQGRIVAIWGLAFKAETDDMRESPALPLVDALLGAGAVVRVHDPAAIPNARGLFGNRVQYAERAYDALQGADALAILTEWLEYRTPDFGRMRALLKTPLVVDGRNLYEPARMARLGFTYLSIGRPVVPCASS